jgi:hypothetical protein
MFTAIVADATTTAITNGCHHRLPGTVPSYPQYLEAAEAARRAAGVTRVHNHLEVVLPPEDYRDDAMLTAAANNALAASATVPEGVEATANNGNLTLAGAVKFPSQRAAAESAVSRLTGVRNVRDEIGFVFDVDPEDVTQLVKEALDRHAVPLAVWCQGQREHGYAHRPCADPGATRRRRGRRMAGTRRHGRYQRTRDHRLTARHQLAALWWRQGCRS